MEALKTGGKILKIAIVCPRGGLAHGHTHGPHDETKVETTNETKKALTTNHAQNDDHGMSEDDDK